MPWEQWLFLFHGVVSPYNPGCRWTPNPPALVSQSWNYRGAITTPGFQMDFYTLSTTLTQILNSILPGQMVITCLQNLSRSFMWQMWSSGQEHNNGLGERRHWLFIRVRCWEEPGLWHHWSGWKWRSSVGLSTKQPVEHGMLNSLLNEEIGEKKKKQKQKATYKNPKWQAV